VGQLQTRSGLSLKPRQQQLAVYESIERCIRCAQCLPVCPTYSLSAMETESPRGRVALVKALLEGKLEATANLDRLLRICLDCRACQTACPNGVRVGEMVVSVRADLRNRGNGARFGRRVVQFVAFDWMLKSPRNVEIAAALARVYQRMGLQDLVRGVGVLRGLPVLDSLERFLPRLPDGALRRQLSKVSPAQGETRHRVGFFLGCVMSTVFADASRATVEVLARNGCEVVVPPEIRCCGAPLLTEGARDKAKKLAAANIELFLDAEVEAVVTDCAACGAELKRYRELFEGDPSYAEKAAEFSAKCVDITELLVQLVPINPPTGEVRKVVTYHEPCHLVHAQGLSREPRELLRMIPGLQLVEMKRSDWCCGSAGAYTFTHRDYSLKLLQQKLSDAAATGAEAIVTGNPGCALQLRYGLEQSGKEIGVTFFTELLKESYDRS